MQCRTMTRCGEIVGLGWYFTHRVYVYLESDYYQEYEYISILPQNPSLITSWEKWLCAQYLNSFRNGLPEFEPLQ